MSFSAQRGKLVEQTLRPVLSPYEVAYLSAAELGDTDTSIERLVDRIRKSACLFAFREPLGTEFYAARDYALNCLEIQMIQPRRVKDWISDCLKCMDCVLLVYVRDVLHDTVPVGASGKVRERDVYSRCEQRGGDLARVGICFHNVYQKRSELEHVQVVTEDGQRRIREISGKKKLQAHGFAVQQLTKALDVMIPLYRPAFPSACTSGLPEDEAKGANAR